MPLLGMVYDVLVVSVTVDPKYEYEPWSLAFLTNVIPLDHQGS